MTIPTNLHETAQSYDVAKKRRTSYGPSAYGGADLTETLYTATYVSDELLVGGVALFTLAGITDYDLSFDIAGYPVVAYTTTVGLYVYWRDPADTTYKHALILTGATTPYICLDTRSTSLLATSDNIVCYLDTVNDFVALSVSSDGYYSTRYQVGVTSDATLNTAGMSEDQSRYVLKVSETASRLWIPTDSPEKLTFWGDSSSIVESGGFATSLNDKSGNGYNWPAGSLAPAVEANAIAGDKSVLRFDKNAGVPNLAYPVGGCDDYANKTGYTWVFFVSRRLNNDSHASGDYKQLLSVLRASGGEQLIGIRQGNSGSDNYYRQAVIYKGGNPQIRREYGNASTDFSMQLAVGKHTQSSVSVYVNGEFAGGTSSSAGGVTSVTDPTYGPVLGGADSSGSTNDLSYSLDGDVACIILGQNTRIYSTSTIDKIFGWAAWEFGLQDLLAVEHPYKYAAPVYVPPSYGSVLQDTYSALLGHYTLAGIAGALWSAQDANGPDLILAGGTAGVRDGENCWVLNGTSDYISLENLVADMIVGESFTMSMRIYIEAAGVPFGSNEADGDNTWFVSITSSGWGATINGGVMKYQTGNIYGAWHELTYTVSNASLSSLFLDGEFVGCARVTSWEDCTQMFVGQELDGTSPSDFLKCGVSRIRVYSTALNTGQIKAIASEVIL